MLTIRRRRRQTNKTRAAEREGVPSARDRQTAGEGPHSVAGRERGTPAGATGAGVAGAGGAVGARAAGRRERRGLGWHGRNVGAATVGAFGSGVTTLASLVLLVAVVIALLIALAILCVDLDANAGNTIVKGIHEGANFFASPFTGLIEFTGHPKRAISVDWGIALLAYLIVGLVASRWIARLGRRGARFERAHRPAV